MKVIGTGVTSCVVKPRPVCVTETTAGSSEVGKIMNTADASQEIKYSKQIKNIDPAGLFSLGPTRICMPRGSPSDIRDELINQGCNTPQLMKDMNGSLSMVVSEYGGISLDVLKSDELRKGLSIFKGRRQIASILATEIIRLLYAIITIQNEGKTHFDLHAGNILYNRENSELKIIDFVNASTGTFMVSNDAIVPLIIRYSDALAHRYYRQYPVELPILAMISTRTSHDKTLYPAFIFDTDIPESILDAIRDGADGRSPSALREALKEIAVDSPLQILSEILFPENIPEGDILFQLRCRAIIGVRQLAMKQSTPSLRTQKAFRESIRTIDSCAVGEILHTFIVKVLGARRRLDRDSLFALLHIVDLLRSPDISERIHAKTALSMVFKLTSALPSDPRGESSARVREYARRLL